MSYGVFETKEEHDAWMADAKATRERWDKIISDTNQKIEDQAANVISDATGIPIDIISGLIETITNASTLLDRLLKKAQKKQVDG